MIPRPSSVTRIAHVVLAAFALAPSGLHAQGRPVSGTVFVDRNGNGIRDAGEMGLRGIIVSNQVDVAVTDAAGSFTFTSAPTGVINVSVPTGYRSVGKFWRAVDATTQSVSFALQPQIQPATFTFVHSSDSHVMPENVYLTQNFRAKAETLHPSFVLVAGDLVRDAMSQTQAQSQAYFDLFAAEFGKMSMPVWTVPGNHDHYGIIRSRSHADSTNPLYGRGMYHHNLGPDYYSFTYGGVHFIGLNTVTADDSAYFGFVDSVQMKWLKQDVAHVPAAMPIVTFDHIPFVSSWWDVLGPNDMALVGPIAKGGGRQTYRHTVGNFTDVLALMHGHNYTLALGAHTHVPEQVRLVPDGKPMRFEQSAAISGVPPFGGLNFPPAFSVYTVTRGVISAPRMVMIDTVEKKTAKK